MEPEPQGPELTEPARQGKHRPIVEYSPGPQSMHCICEASGCVPGWHAGHSMPSVPISVYSTARYVNLPEHRCSCADALPLHPTGGALTRLEKKRLQAAVQAMRGAPKYRLHLAWQLRRWCLRRQSKVRPQLPAQVEVASAWWLPQESCVVRTILNVART